MIHRLRFWLARLCLPRTQPLPRRDDVREWAADHREER